MKVMFVQNILDQLNTLKFLFPFHCTELIYRLQNNNEIYEICVCIYVYIYMRDAQCAETNDKSIFQFLVFEIWSLQICRYASFFLSKDAHCSETDY